MIPELCIAPVAMILDTLIPEVCIAPFDHYLGHVDPRTMHCSSIVDNDPGHVDPRGVCVGPVLVHGGHITPPTLTWA